MIGHKQQFMHIGTMLKNYYKLLGAQETSVIISEDELCLLILNST